MSKTGFLADLFMWVGKFLKDLFYGNGNKYAELGRVLVFGCVASYDAAAIWNARLGQPIDLLAFGGGLAAILTAGIGAAAVKDWVAAKAISQETQDATAAVTAETVAAQPAAAPASPVTVNVQPQPEPAAPAGTEADPTHTIVVNEPGEPVPVTGKAKP